MLSFHEDVVISLFQQHPSFVVRVGLLKPCALSNLQPWSGPALWWVDGPRRALLLCRLCRFAVRQHMSLHAWRGRGVDSQYRLGFTWRSYQPAASVAIAAASLGGRSSRQRVATKR